MGLVVLAKTSAERGVRRSINRTEVCEILSLSPSIIARRLLKGVVYKRVEITKGRIVGKNVVLHNPVYQLHIALEWVRPVVWRRVLVSGNTKLDTLQEIFQAAMGWSDCHLHMFIGPDESWMYSDPFRDIDGCADEGQVSLRKVAPHKGYVFDYLYDFGDNWLHRVEVEEITTQDLKMARCIDGEGSCPPEDCGGHLGYSEFVAAMSDPKHPNHNYHKQNYSEWYTGDFDPKAFSAEKMSARIERALTRDEAFLAYLKSNPKDSGLSPEQIQAFIQDLEKDKR